MLVAPQRLWQVTVSTSTEAEEAVVELIQQITASSASAYHEAATDRLRVNVHLAELPMASEELRRQIKAGLAHIRTCGLDPAPARIAIRHLPAKDWAESWKEHFPPLRIGQTLLIKPEWVQVAPRAGQQVVTLDPGLSFGTGHHPTTRFCLRELVRARPKTPAKSMLDMGTGSGLLAIAAAKLGYRPVCAFDLDPLAVKAARVNARRNGVGRQVRVSQTDLRTARRDFGPHALVCANLQADLLEQYATVIAGSVAPKGRLVLAGILRSELAAVVQIYEQLQHRVNRVRHDGEWSSVSLDRI